MFVCIGVSVYLYLYTYMWIRGLICEGFFFQITSLHGLYDQIQFARLAQLYLYQLSHLLGHHTFSTFSHLIVFPLSYTSSNAVPRNYLLTNILANQNSNMKYILGVFDMEFCKWFLYNLAVSQVECTYFSSSWLRLNRMY